MTLEIVKVGNPHENVDQAETMERLDKQFREAWEIGAKIEKERKEITGKLKKLNN